MIKFIWVRDLYKVQHYINVNHITRVTKSPPTIIINDGSPSRQIYLSEDEYDTFEEVVSKIGASI